MAHWEFGGIRTHNHLRHKQAHCQLCYKLHKMWPEQDSNLHGHYCPRDFKSRAPTNSATRPKIIKRFAGMTGIEPISEVLETPSLTIDLHSYKAGSTGFEPVNSS